MWFCGNNVVAVLQGDMVKMLQNYYTNFSVKNKQFLTVNRAIIVWNPFFVYVI